MSVDQVRERAASFAWSQPAGVETKAAQQRLQVLESFPRDGSPDLPIATNNILHQTGVERKTRTTMTVMGAPVLEYIATEEREDTEVPAAPSSGVGLSGTVSVSRRRPSGAPCRAGS